MLVPRRIDRLWGRVGEQVLRRKRRGRLIEAAWVVRDVLVETAPAIPRRAVAVQLVLQHPRPCDITSVFVRARVARAHLDELVEQAHRPDDEPSELRTVENGARPCVDAKRPRCMRRVTRANVSCERVPGCDRSAKEPRVRRSARRTAGIRGRAAPPCRFRRRRRTAGGARRGNARTFAHPRRPW